MRPTKRERRPGVKGAYDIRRELDLCRECLGECELCDSFGQWRLERMLDSFFAQRRRR